MPLNFLLGNLKAATVVHANHGVTVSVQTPPEAGAGTLLLVYPVRNQVTSTGFISYLQRMQFSMIFSYDMGAKKPRSRGLGNKRTCAGYLHRFLQICNSLNIS